MNTTKPTAEQIAAWKKEHGQLHLMTTSDGHEAIVREPKLADLELAMDRSKKANAKSLDFNRTLYRRCRLWEQDGLWNDEGRQLEVLTAIGGIAEVKEASVKKL